MSFGKRTTETKPPVTTRKIEPLETPSPLWPQLRRIFGGVAIGLSLWFASFFLMPSLMGRSVAQRFEEPAAQRVVSPKSESASALLTKQCATPQFGAQLKPRMSDPLTGAQQEIFAEGDNVRRVATHIVCQMSNDRDRFCRSEVRSALVSEIKSYLTLRRSGLRIVARYTNIAPSELEASYGDASRHPEHEKRRRPNDARLVEALAALVAIDKDMIASLRRLIEDGYVSIADLSGFLGMFMPTELEPLLTGIDVKGRPCT